MMLICSVGTTNPCMRQCMFHLIIAYLILSLKMDFRIMLIDLYERPHDPEASKSRAFIDRILSLTGPDGGVVGDEDEITTSRPLKDGGREAWDMIRRLRRKAWQKAGLDPQRLWTESVPVNYNNNGAPDYSKAAAQAASSQLAGPPESLLSPRPEESSMPNSPSPHSIASPPFPATDKGSMALPNLGTTLTSTVPSPTNTGPLSGNQQQPRAAVSSSPTASSLSQFVDALDDWHGTSTIPAVAMPASPPAVDPSSLSFDWDEWDAVFGQHLHIPDEMMADDPVSGFDCWPVSGSS